jgi:hypothetical protein
MVSAADRPLAGDLVAEAFTKAWAAWQKVRGLAEPQAWAIRTAINAPRVPVKRHRLGEPAMQGNAMPGGDVLMGADRRVGQLVRSQRHRAGQAAVGFGQHQQVVDQLFVAFVGAQQVRARAPQVLGHLRVVQRHLGQQSLHRQRGAQLV